MMSREYKEGGQDPNEDGAGWRGRQRQRQEHAGGKEKEGGPSSSAGGQP